MSKGLARSSYHSCQPSECVVAMTVLGLQQYLPGVFSYLVEELEHLLRLRQHTYRRVRLESLSLFLRTM